MPRPISPAEGMSFRQRTQILNLRFGNVGSGMSYGNIGTGLGNLGNANIDHSNISASTSSRKPGLCNISWVTTASALLGEAQLRIQQRAISTWKLANSGSNIVFRQP